MRVQFRADGASVEALRRDFTAVASHSTMAWQLHDLHTSTRTLLMVSKFGHCLNDLLFRSEHGLRSTSRSPLIVSNHRDFERLVASPTTSRSIHMPVTPETKPEAEARLLELVDEYDVDLVVLARYMQVLSNELCTQARGPRDQHPPLVPAQLQGRQALPPGARRAA